MAVVFVWAGLSAPDARGDASPAPEPPAGLRVSAEGLPFRFPPTLDPARFEGVGRVELLVAINQSGHTVEWVTLEATHLALAVAVERTLPLVKFEADEPFPEEMILRLGIRFRSDGVVSAVSGFDHVAGHLDRLAGEESELALKRVSARNLDAPLERIDTNQPYIVFSEEGIQYTGRARVEIFVDRFGRVSLPRVIDSDNEGVAEAAFLSVSEWRFRPPTENGQPRVVRVVAPFVIQPPGEGDVGSENR
ncbi:MAG: energy transducer TonB [Opitutales bacterium]|nr:energy transducer TonB [Opitutales bacterium]